MVRPGWYSDHPSACTCVGCSERGAVGTRTADRRGGEQPPTRVGTSLGNGGGYGRGGGTGGGNAWKWLAAVVVGVILIAVIYQAGSWPESGQPTPANVVPTSTTASEATPPIRTAPTPAPDVRATTEAAIAATVEALRPTSTTEAVPLALATTPTSVPETRPTIPTPCSYQGPGGYPVSRANCDILSRSNPSGISPRFQERPLAGARRPPVGFLDQSTELDARRDRRYGVRRDSEHALHRGHESLRRFVPALAGLGTGRHQRRRGRSD